MPSDEEVHTVLLGSHRETSALYGGDDDASSTSDSDFETEGHIGRKQQKARAKAESGSDSEFERRPQKKRKELPARALPGRSARPANYKDASSEDDDGNAEDDESVSIGKFSLSLFMPPYYMSCIAASHPL